MLEGPALAEAGGTAGMRGGSAAAACAAHRFWGRPTHHPFHVRCAALQLMDDLKWSVKTLQTNWLARWGGRRPMHADPLALPHPTLIPSLATRSATQDAAWVCLRVPPLPCEAPTLPPLPPPPLHPPPSAAGCARSGSAPAAGWSRGSAWSPSRSRRPPCWRWQRAMQAGRRCSCQRGNACVLALPASPLFVFSWGRGDS
jgi:hypothetical protein